MVSKQMSFISGCISVACLGVLTFSSPVHAGSIDIGGLIDSVKDDYNEVIEKTKRVRKKNADEAKRKAATTSSGTTIYHPTRKYILICREQGLLSDHIPTISISCTGEEQSCKQKFEQQVSSKYGSFSSACGKLVRANWYYSTIRIE